MITNHSRRRKLDGYFCTNNRLFIHKGANTVENGTDYGLWIGCAKGVSPKTDLAFDEKVRKFKASWIKQGESGGRRKKFSTGAGEDVGISYPHFPQVFHMLSNGIGG